MKKDAVTRKGRLGPPPSPAPPQMTLPGGSRWMLGPVARGAPSSGQLMKPVGNSNQIMTGTTLRKRDR